MPSSKDQTTLSVYQWTKEEFDRLKPTGSSNDEFLNTLLEAYKDR